MRSYWTVLGVILTGFFAADAVACFLDRTSEVSQWYMVISIVLTILSGFGVALAWTRPSSIVVLNLSLCIFATMLSALLPSPLMGIQAIAGILGFFATTWGASFQTGPRPQPLPEPPRQHPFLSAHVLPRYWTVVGIGLAAFFAIDIGTFKLAGDLPKSSGNIGLAGLFLALTCVALVLAWRRVANVAAAFSIVSVFSITFTANFGRYYFTTLMTWQLWGGIALLLLSLFGSLTIPVRNPDLAPEGQ